MSHCDLHSEGQITALEAKLKETEFWSVDLRGQPVNILSTLRVKTKQISIILYQQNISVAGI